MPPTIPNLKVWPASPAGTSFMLHLFIHELSGLPQDGLRWSPSGEIAVEIEWRGNRQRTDALLLRRPHRSSTSRRTVRHDGSVSWEEGLNHVCNLKMDGYQIYKTWIINLEIHGYGFGSIKSGAVVGKARIDAAAYARTKGKSLRIPVCCDLNGFVAVGGLTVTMEFIEVERKEKPTWALLRLLSFNSKHTESNNGSSSRESPSTQVEIMQDNAPELQREHRRGLSSMSFRKPKLPWSEKWRTSTFKERVTVAVVDDEEDEKGVGRTNSLRVLMERDIPRDTAEEIYDGLDVGGWVKRRVVSRDGKMEMIADVFFGSIDQCSDKAAGEGACAVLVTVIADWLHRNKRTLPLRQELDEIIRAGSSEWRALCQDSTHRRRFSDHHFDLETVLASKIRPLAIATPLSYVGFFAFEDTPDGLEYLNQAMSFDSIFDELIHASTHDNERIYIASWNDHFFILKVTSDAIYLIDTLGERLYEGCNQAHIIRFADDSMVMKIQEVHERNGELGEEVVVCEGMGSCREYIKGFLAAVPLREMRSEIDRGVVSHADVHRRLQIEFHYTIPL